MSPLPKADAAQKPDCLQHTPPPRVFSQKSPQAIENKGKECAKEREERKRVCKLLKMRGLRIGKADSQKWLSHLKPNGRLTWQWA
jgi:hypothetical protein